MEERKAGHIQSAIHDLIRPQPTVEPRSSSGCFNLSLRGLETLHARCDKTLLAVGYYDAILLKIVFENEAHNRISFPSMCLAMVCGVLLSDRSSAPLPRNF